MTPNATCDHKAGNIQKRKQKPGERKDYWPDGPYNSAFGEESLWKAVLTQAFQDATASCRSSELYYYKVEAIRWLSGNSADFQDVCLRAGLDPVTVRRRAKKAIGNPRAWQVESGMSERYERRREMRLRKRMERAAARTENLSQGCLILHLFSGRASA